eukprot:CAMPEP_0118658732 /NCGR_PEP_ID=MMETSP0785-20121206/14729_1 /TAXON_ID=91992 /ORGANISM="Bolidomonas pacifica, Strain CCMP 1866" /LENGTH=409 /DNA_ID=CAMNT_0006551777 /DNA_START=274 /DNA_END=1499 /DNA_ORIENTATION=+
MDWLTEILGHASTGGKKIVRATMRPGLMFSGGNSSVAIFDLIYEGEEDNAPDQKDKAPKSVCVKLMPKDSLVPGWLLKRFWKAEVFYYQKLLSSSVGFPQPTCYYSRYEKSHAVLVMNEMTKGHLSCGDSVRDLTYAEACVSVMILARFHAKWWGAKDPRLNKLGRFDSGESGVTCKFLMGGAKHFLAIDEYKPIHPVVEAMITKVRAVFKLLKRGPFTLTHGDSRSDNFFYEGEFDDQDVGDYDKGEYDKILDDDDDEDSSVSSMNSASSVRQSFGSSNASSDRAKAALCDFQMIMVSNPMRDYANFVVNSLAPADRKAWNDKLIRLYHAELNREGVDTGVFTFEQAKIDARIMTLWPMLCNISISEKSASSYKIYQNTLNNGGTLNVKDARHFNLLKKTRTRLMSAA